MPRANGITRRELLTSIKTNGPMTADELARVLGISQVAVRQHLATLEAEGVIQVSVERRGLGRPSHRYALTDRGDEMFPRSYASLANAILDEMRAWQGDEAVHQIFGRLQERACEVLLPRLQNKDLAACVHELARYQTENGFMAEVVEEQPEDLRLMEHNCPLIAIARQHPCDCCASEIALYRRLLPDADIEREQYLLNGDHACVFRIRARSQDAGRDYPRSA